jgi:hypothetical protein
MLSGFRKFSLLSLILLLAFTPGLMFGQGIVTGSISGTVVDPQQAVIGGAKITVKNDATNAESVTNSNAEGIFRVSNLPVGTYTVTIEAAKFSTRKLSGVVVNSGRETSLGTQSLKVGGEGTTIEVTEAPPLVESTSSQVSTSYDARKVADNPLVTNLGFDALALLVPGVVSVGDNSFSNTNGAGFSSNGQRGRSNNFQIDGQSNNDNSVAGPSIFLSNQDVIGEFQIITNNFSAEYGRNSGSVVNYITKQGTNSWHGSAHEYYTGNWAQSHSNEERSGVFGFCEPGQPVGTITPFAPSGCKAVTRDGQRYVENRFGGTFGGPIMRDKMWFFASAQWDRIRTAGGISSSGSSITPTATGLTQLATIFGAANPGVATLAAYGPAAITAGNPTFGSLQNLIVCSNAVTCGPVEFGTISRTLTSLTNDRQFTGRYDWQIGSKDRFFARYIYQDTAQTNVTGRFAAGMVVDLPAKDQQIGLDWSRSWTNNFVNQARFSYSRAGFGFEGGTTGCVQGTILNCPSGFSWSGGGTLLAFGVQNNLPQGRLINVTQYQDNATWVIGKHTLKFGGEYGRQRSPNVFLPNINGTFTFARPASESAGASSCAGLFPGVTANPFWISNGSYTTNESVVCAFSRFLQNQPTQLSLTDGPPKFNFKEQDLSFYFQDDWKIKDNLTLNLGLRWEWNQQAINLLHDITVANQTGPTPFWDTTLPLNLTTLPSIPQDLNNFGPNIGFAWTPKIWKSILGDGKTVIRGGFRIAYDPAFYNIFLNVATAAPVVNAGTITLAQGAAIPAGGAPTGASLRSAGFLGLIPVGANPGARNQTFVTPDFHNPYTQQWSLGMQRSLTSKFALEVRYAGNHTVGNFQTINGNPQVNVLAASFPSEVPAGVTACTTVGAPGINRANCNKRLLRIRGNTAFSIYHGLQNELRISDWHGLTGSFAYTWSKNIDNASEIFSTFGGGSTIAGAQNPFNINRAERATSGLDFTHVFTFYLIYETPWFKKQNGVVGRLLGGWQFNPVYRYRSGQPFSAVQEGYSASQSGLCDGLFSATFFGGDTCRPFLSNPNAPLDVVGQCTNAAAPDCGLIDYNSGAPATATGVHWIYNDAISAQFFGTPFGGPRNVTRGQNFNQVDFSIFKSVKVREGMKFRIEASVNNLFNRQYRGVPDPDLDSGDLANFQSSAMNNFFNTSGRRRLIIGAKFTF